MSHTSVDKVEVVIARVQLVGNPSKPSRLVISGRQVISREGLRALLMSITGFEVISEASDGVAGLQLAIHHGADVLIHDLPEHGDRELEFLHRMSSEALPVRVLLLAGSFERTDLLKPLQLGAHGMLPKDSATIQVLTEAIRAI